MPEAGLKLIVQQPDSERREFLVNKPSLTVGRAQSNEIVLSDLKSSRVHARFEWKDGQCSVTDMGSSNGTSVNGRSVTSATLSPGDSVTLGDTSIHLEIGDAAAQTQALNIDAVRDMQTVIEQPTITVALNNTDAPRLAIHALGETWEIELTQDRATIGRQPTNDVVIESTEVSRLHAEIQRRSDGFVIVDRGSTNGTWHLGQRIEEHRLKDGDTVRIGPAQLIYKEPFTSADLEKETVVGMALTNLPTVVFVPGIMGSELWEGSERIWPNVRLLLGRSDRMRPEVPLEPRGLLNSVVIIPGLFKIDIYRRMGDYLVDSLGYTRGKNLYEFAYDWRQDNRVSAQKLAQAIEEWNIQGPIVIIGHSMGCLLSRYYIEKLGGKRRISRLIQIGAPQRGSARTIDILLTGRTVTPMGLGHERLKETVAVYPSLYQLLPSLDCVFDDSGAAVNVLEEDSWVDDKFKPLLHAARDFHRELPVESSISNVCIFGYGLKTPSRIRLLRSLTGAWQRLDVEREASGDTVVPEISAILSGAEIHPVHQPHGTLFVDNDVKMRLRMELTRPGLQRS